MAKSSRFRKYSCRDVRFFDRGGVLSGTVAVSWHWSDDRRRVKAVCTNLRQQGRAWKQNSVPGGFRMVGESRENFVKNQDA
jgi:hypothetical protein